MVDNDYNKKYYAKNKDKIIKQLTEKVYCKTCQCYVCKNYLNKHNQSVKHKKNDKVSTNDDLVSTLEKIFGEIIEKVKKTQLDK